VRLLPVLAETHRRADFIVDSSQRFDHTLAQKNAMVAPHCLRSSAPLTPRRAHYDATTAATTHHQRQTGRVYADGDGCLLADTTGESPRRWGFIKKRLDFCQVVQHGDVEGSLHRRRLGRLGRRASAPRGRPWTAWRPNCYIASVSCGGKSRRYVRRRWSWGFGSSLARSFFKLAATPRSTMSSPLLYAARLRPAPRSMITSERDIVGRAGNATEPS
jgi:hypothetical protein